MTIDPNPTPFREDLVRAALDGKKIQWFNNHYQDEKHHGWLTFFTAREAIHALVSYPDRQFRIRPEPVEKWIGFFRDSHRDNLNEIVLRGFVGRPSNNHGCHQLARLMLDPETLEVVSFTNEP